MLQSYEQQLSHFDPSDYPFVTFKNTTIEEYIHPQGFDFVFCMNGINHVSDLKKALGYLIDCTKSGGYVILTIDAHNYSLIKYLFRLVPGDILHPHQYNLMEYMNMLSMHEYQIILEKRIKNSFPFDHYLLAARKGTS